MLFYTSMSLVHGWFERRGLGVPTMHSTRRRMVEKRLPHLYEDYRRICSMSEDARYGEGYAMDDRAPEGARYPRAHLWGDPLALGRQACRIRRRRFAGRACRVSGSALEQGAP